MRFQYSSYFAVLGATAFISAWVGITAWRRRSSSSASQPFIWMMVAITGYATVAALEAGAIALADKIFWSKLEYAGSGSVITLFLIFVLDFTHHQRWLTWRNIALLWLIPVCNLVMVVTNEWHQLIWTGFLIYPHKSYVDYQHGLGFFWVMGCSYVYTFSAIFLLAKAALRPSVLHRQQSSLMLLGGLVPLLGGTIYMFNLTPPSLNITPMSFMLTGVIIFTSLFHFRMFDLVPVARDTLIENMSDGVLVLDMRKRIMDLNPAAQRLIGLKPSCVGQPIDQVLPEWQSLLYFCQHPKNRQAEFVIEGATQRYIELRMTLLSDRHRRFTGCLLVLRDITQKHQAEIEMRRANEQLQQQLQAIERLQVQLREQAIRDGLTGLFNRRYFEDRLSQELRRALKEGYPVAIILIDVDHFKTVNDTFGHQGGDQVLQALSRLLQESSRTIDIPCRYGGEEFVLVLPKMDLSCALTLAEKIRLSFQSTPVMFNTQPIQTTLSGGVGVFPDHGKTKDGLLHEVDQALYMAKALGRNQIQSVRSLGL